jgi:hypothetical protein
VQKCADTAGSLIETKFPEENEYPYFLVIWDELVVDGWTNLTSSKWTANIKSLLRKKITTID